MADKRGATRAQVALAWLLSKPVIQCPDRRGDELGAATRTCSAALSVDLSPEEIEQLEEPYEPHAIAGH